MILTAQTGSFFNKMPFNLELRPEYVSEKMPHRDEMGRLVVERAPEVTWLWAERNWQETNEAMGEAGIDRSQCQVVVLTNKDDVTTPFYRSLRRNPLGAFPVATTIEEEYPDRELEIILQDEAVEVESVYIVASLLSERDYSRARAVADHYKHVLKAQCVTLVSSFIGRGREDKNVDEAGHYVPKTINIRSEIKGLSPVVDRMLVFEPHSSATQAYAAEFGISLAPLSPWRYLIDILRQRREITPENAVIVRPDIGRNIAAIRIEEYLGIPSVSFDKKRLDGTEVEVYELSAREQELVKGKKGILYDDEVSSADTLEKIANANQRYGMRELYVCLVHCKFTPKWRERMDHPLLSVVLGTDSRTPIGNIAMSEKTELVSLAPLLREIIEADIQGVNFWRDARYKDMILQEYPTGVKIEKAMRERIKEFKDGKAEEKLLVEAIKEDEDFFKVDFGNGKVLMATENLNNLIRGFLEEEGVEEGYSEYNEDDEKGRPLAKTTYYTDTDGVFLTEIQTLTEKVEGDLIALRMMVQREGKPARDKAEEAIDTLKGKVSALAGMIK